jgi:hypothetical protein
MKRPIGVTLLAVGAALAGFYQVWLALLFAGVLDFSMIGKSVSFAEPQWGAALWSTILAAVWLYVAEGFWSLRAYAWSFGRIISLFTLVWGFFSVLFGSSVEMETVPWLLAGAVYLYLSSPGIEQLFIASEWEHLSPEEQAAYSQAAAARAGTAAAAVAAIGPAPSAAPVVAAPAAVAAAPAPVATPAAIDAPAPVPAPDAPSPATDAPSAAPATDAPPPSA